jgi:2,4-dichlorophenol 6-monooxygenase
VAGFLNGGDTVEVPVLIVGGGAAGLTASSMLGRLGVESLLVERHPGTSIVPKAHIIHSRTMEIFDQWGLASAVREAGSPAENFSHTSWYTSLGGEEAWDGKLIGRVASWSGAELAPYYETITAEPMANLPQHLLEPILRERAEAESGEDRVLFSHELTGLEQTGDGVTATVLDRESGESSSVLAQYVVAADGGKTVGELLGVPMLGPEPFVDVVSITFSADFSPYLLEDDSLIRLFLRPAPNGEVRRFSIVASGPDRWDRHCTSWRSGVILPVGSERDPESYTVDRAVEDLRALFELPELEIGDVQMGHWLIESVIAERFQVGRVFLVGDAAHRHSPMGGLGLNTGIQDVHNLVWKLDDVLRHGAAPSLLDSYEPERQPVAERRIEFATFSFFNHLSVNGGFGMLPGASEEHNRGVLEGLFSDTADGETRRAQLGEMINTLRREFQHADLDLGYEYADSAVIVPDGSPAPPRDPVGHDYEPVARPGHRLPHAWLRRGDERVSTQQLIVPGNWLLLAGPTGEAWVEAAKTLAADLGLALDAYLVGPGAELDDREGAWASLRGHDDGGAVLVRPDGHVAFRGGADVTDQSTRIRAAVSQARGGVPKESALAG